MKYTFFETESGKKIKTAQFNGYRIAERLLEDLMFQVTIQDDGTLKVWVNPEDEEYLSQYTENYLAEAEKVAVDYDCYEDPATGEECWFENYEEIYKALHLNEAKKEPIEVKASSLADITEQMKQRGLGIPKTIQDIMSQAGSVYGVGPGGGSMTLGVGSDGQFGMETDLEEIEPEVPKVYGKYTTKIKIFDFLGVMGNINLLSKKATIKGKFFDSLNLDGVVFEMTLCDDNTFDFKQITLDGSDIVCSEADIARYVTVFEDGNYVGYRSRSVFSDYIFTATHTVKDKEISVESYLVVEPKKPYDGLLAFMEEDEVKTETTTELPVIDEEDFANKMKLLFDDEEDVEAIKETPVPKLEPAEEVVMSSRILIAQEFLEAKKEKREALNKKIENFKTEYKGAKNNYNFAVGKMKECDTEIKLLASRIDSLEINEPFNGYYFFIPETLSAKCTLPDDVKLMIETKINANGTVNTEAFMRMFENAIFQFRIGLDIEGVLTELDDFKNISPILKDFDLVNGGKVFVSDNKLFYEGQLDWSTIGNKLIRLGFAENNKFEEMCKPEVPDEFNEAEKEAESFDENAEHLAEFEETYGYPMGDEFLFAIGYNPNATNEICDSQTWIAITPKSYFDKEGYAYDQHLEHVLKAKFPVLSTLGNNFEEMVEGSFQIDKDANTCEDINNTIEILCKSGLKFSTKFQELMSNTDTQLVKYLIAITDNSIIVD